MEFNATFLVSFVSFIVFVVLIFIALVDSLMSFSISKFVA